MKNSTAEVIASLEARVVRTGEAAEYHLTVIPTPGADPAAQARQAFAAIAQFLKTHNAWILEERVVGTAEALRAALPVRASQYGPLDDGVPPTWLGVPQGIAGPLAGVQVRAVAGVARPEPLIKKGVGAGRILRSGARTYALFLGICAPEAGAFGMQSRRAFEKAEELLKAAGGDMHSIARTWWFLRDIDRDYAEFNKVRREFFIEKGLLGPAIKDNHLPASTGIGIAPCDPSLTSANPVLKATADCCVDVMAAFGGPSELTEYYAVAGNQHSAFNYGSAFARASRLQIPAGKIAYVSGTADIDTDGLSCNIGKAREQVETTLTNVRAVLSDIGCKDGDVVQALAYCKTPEVEAVWNQIAASLGWPQVACIADVCRPELLFELEAAACPGAAKVSF